MDRKSVHDIEQYTACVIFYVTDLACNRLKDLEPYITNQDKETKRIWKALHRRYRNFFIESNKCYGSGVEFIANFSEIMDENTDDNLDNLVKFVEKKLDEHNIGNSEFIARLEVARICVDFAVVVTHRMIQVMREKNIKAELCNVFDFTEIAEIITNFYTWVTRKIRANSVQVNVNENGEIKEYIDNLYKNIMEYDNFSKAYQYALDNTNKD